MSREYPIVKRPDRRYPLPDDTRTLDRPWSDVEHNRNARVDLFRRGHRPTDDPTRKNPNISPSNLPSKL